MVAAFTFACALSFQGQDQSPDAVVAFVEGRKITYKDIRMPDESLRLKYRLIHGKFPESRAEEDKLALLSEKTEKELLTSKMKSIIRQDQIARFGIVVTKEEMAERKRALLEGIDLGSELAKEQERITFLLQALTAVMRNEMSGKEAYERYLSDHFSYEEWLAHKQYYNTPKRIAMLEGLLKMTPEDLRKPDVGTRAWVEGEKLNEKIDAELAQTDAEFAEYLGARRTNDVETAQKIEGTNPNYLQAKRAEWWRQRYAEANIQILDKKYADVLQRLVSPVASPASAGTPIDPLARLAYFSILLTGGCSCFDRCSCSDRVAVFLAA
ncbi:MAG: hypothetical protein ACRD5G_06065 [Candidatus Acidiferrales bacterium]